MAVGEEAERPHSYGDHSDYLYHDYCGDRRLSCLSNLLHRCRIRLHQLHRRHRVAMGSLLALEGPLVDPEAEALVALLGVTVLMEAGFVVGVEVVAGVVAEDGAASTSRGVAEADPGNGGCSCEVVDAGAALEISSGWLLG